MPDIEGVSLAPSIPVASAPVATSAPAVAPGTAAPAAPVAQPGVTLSSPAAVVSTVETTPPVVAPAVLDPWSSLPDETKAVATAKGWKTTEDAVKAYKELETKFSSTRPADAPKDVAAYDAVVTPPQNAKDVGYNDKFATWFKGAAFANKIPVEAAKGLHDSLVAWAGENATADGEGRTAALNEQVTKSATALHTAWGEPNTPAFARNLDMSMRAIRNLDPDLKTALIDTGAIVVVGGKEMVANHVIVRALSKVGAQMYAEDSVFGEIAANSNPFDPSTLDLTAQSRVFQKDKSQAKSLIMALKPEHQARYANLLASIG